MLPRPFNPHYGSNTQLVLVAATPQARNLEAQDGVVRVVNASGGALMYFRTYSSLDVVAPVASAIDYPVLPGMAVLVSKDQAHDRISLFSTAGTTCDVMTGNGGV